MQKSTLSVIVQYHFKIIVLQHCWKPQPEFNIPRVWTNSRRTHAIYALGTSGIIAAQLQI